MTPPTIASVSPRGLPVGQTSELLVDGLNLTGATGIFFDRAGIKGTVKSIRQLPDLSDIRLGSAGLVSSIDLGPLPPRMQITFEVTMEPGVETGLVNFRVLTPLGTTPEGRFLVENTEPVPMQQQGNAISLPSLLAGTIAKAGDIGMYKIKVAAGEELSFENQAARAGSSLQPVVTFVREDGSIEGEYGSEGGAGAVAFRHKFRAEGLYTIRIGDFLQSGKATHFYRVRVSRDPLKPAKIMGAEDWPTPTDGKVSVSGVIDAPGREQLHRFRAKKGEAIVVDLIARRSSDSELDSVIEVLDAKGKLVETGVARALLETNMTLNDRASVDKGVRLNSVTSLNAGDYLLIGSEIVRISELPEGPDDDVILEGFGAARRSFFATSAESHHLDSPVYKVKLHPAGTQFSPNGLPLFRLYARNDDGGPAIGRDSYLQFVAPEDGEYTVRVKDSRGVGGPRF
ncbi:MAG: hypothetical protein H7039_10010, partial [Bryobacteraceae bacterium]|nr:hypothetical protein [Bryobacteraceae bacterium]